MCSAGSGTKSLELFNLLDPGRRMFNHYSPTCRFNLLELFNLLDPGRTSSIVLELCYVCNTIESCMMGRTSLVLGKANYSHLNLEFKQIKPRVCYGLDTGNVCYVCNSFKSKNKLLMLQ
jgi:hypothetical protein